MTSQEELLYLSDLLMQATLWRDTEDNGKRPLELEVEDRINRLRNELQAPSSTQAPPKPKHRPAAEKVRVYENGKYVWHDREDCEQVPFARSRTGYKWRVKYINSAGQAVQEAEQ